MSVGLEIAGGFLPLRARKRGRADQYRAERALRHGVIYRKVSPSTRSERGTRFVERMLSVVQPLRLQVRSAPAFLYEAAVALLTGHTAPALLPS